ncbi:reverse transcriptase domain-containing protein [Tanacetum coccineum]|uniref:Reverse transcriptase domain-containing protein n=1 Tax=Tanacetum coccineum TaxID=301880 RepID=A0ABQ5BDN1_9ASTR
MPFGLCNAPATFERCMTAIFHELIEDSMKVFMDDFSIFGSSFDHCLKNLVKMLKMSEETNLILNWRKCHFMVKEGIVLGHKVSGSGIEVDKAKIKAISKLPYPTKAIRSFLGHAEFDIKIRDKKGAKNLVADHLSRIENPDLGILTRDEIRDLFLEERLMAISNKNNELWCVAGDEAAQILRQCHNGPSGGHHAIATTARKVFEAAFYWGTYLSRCAKDWSYKLDDALWHSTAFKTPLGTTPFRIIYGKHAIFLSNWNIKHIGP